MGYIDVGWINFDYDRIQCRVPYEAMNEVNGFAP